MVAGRWGWVQKTGLNQEINSRELFQSLLPSVDPETSPRIPCLERAGVNLNPTGSGARSEGHQDWEAPKLSLRTIGFKPYLYWQVWIELHLQLRIDLTYPRGWEACGGRNKEGHDPLSWHLTHSLPLCLNSCPTLADFCIHVVDFPDSQVSQLIDTYISTSGIQVYLYTSALWFIECPQEPVCLNGSAIFKLCNLGQGKSPLCASMWDDIRTCINGCCGIKELIQYMARSWDFRNRIINRKEY